MDESIILIEGIPIRKFNFNTKSSLATEWRKFAWDFKCFMAIKKLQDESEKVKIGYLLLLMGPECQSLLSRLLSSKEDCENFDKLFKAFEDHFIPMSSVKMQLCPLM